MKKAKFAFTAWSIFIGLLLVQLPSVIHAQQLNEYVILGKNVQVASSSTLSSGSVGANNSVLFTGNFQLNGSINSGGTITLQNNSVISGNVSAANSLSLSQTTFLAGSSTSISGNVDVNGNITISGGVISGTITHPYNTIYSGPAPAGGEKFGTPIIPGLPALPPITNIPAAGNRNIKTSQIITPGAYGNVTLANNNILTLSGTGTYIFNSINNSGNNGFVFDFKNSASGTFTILIIGNANLNKTSASLKNGGDASRIIAETHGTGDASTGGYAWNITNGSSGTSSLAKWLGTVWAPYGGIYIGSGTGQNYYSGAFYSGADINVQSGAKISLAAYLHCNAAIAKAGPDKVLDCNTSSVILDGSASSPNQLYSWTTYNNGHIVTGATTLTPTVDAVGTYVLKVKDVNGACESTDTVVVGFNNCIVPYYPPPEGGKIRNLIGAELNSLYENSGMISDSVRNIFILMHDSVMIEVIALNGQYQTLLSLLKTSTYGMTDFVDNGPNTLIITGKFPIKNLLKLNSLPDLIDHCRPVFPSIGNAGVINSAGDTSLRADFVRNGYGLSGEGVKIGVISNSYNTIPGNPAYIDVINGDLPGEGNADNPVPVQVLKEYPYGKLSDEGRAMLQIVHDIAPKSTLAFRTGFINAGDFALGIKELQNAGCNVIVDDVTYITEPFFQDGVVAAAVDDVAAKGVSYFSSAGNFGNQSYEGTFNPTTPPAGIQGSAHNFSNGDIYQKITVTPGTYTMVLQWQDGIYSSGSTTSGTANDLDIYLTDNNGNILFGFNRDNIGADPIEVLPFTVVQSTTVNIIIVRASGTGNVKFKYIFFRGNGIISKYNNGGSTIVGQANAAGAMAVGAVLFSNTPQYGVNPPTIASFSSRGGTTVNGIVRNKPEFAAVNGVNTTVEMGGVNIDGNAFPNFFGTSAAAPHAAAVAALLIEGKKKFAAEDIDPTGIRNLLEQNAIDMDVPGFDFNTGYGFIQADRAMRTFATPKPAIYSIELTDSSIKPGTEPIEVTITGDYLDETSVVLLRGNPVQTTAVSTTEIKAIIPAFTGNPVIQVYTAPLSSSGLDGGYSDSLYFFSTVKKLITISADNKTIRFGEKIPDFTSTILVDGVSLENSGYTLASLGLDSINYTTTATRNSNVGIYAIKPAMKTYSADDSIYIGLLETNKYVFNNGLLTIAKMPLVITPKDTTLTYGDKISGFDFNFSYDNTSVAIEDKVAFLNFMQTSYQYNLSDAVALMDASIIVDTRALVNSDLENLSFLVSTRALVNARELINAVALVDGITVYDTTKIVDISPAAVFNYQENPDTATLVSSIAQINTRALVNIVALMDGIALVDSRELINGAAIVNGNTVSDSSNANVAVIIDQTDVSAPADDTLTVLKSLNLITGTTVGTFAIVPGAFLNENFDVSYRLGKLTIVPDALTVAIKNITVPYGSPVGNLSADISGYDYQDNIDSVFSSFRLKLLDKENNEVSLSSTLKPGIYTIVADAAIRQPSNYAINFINGTLTVNKIDLTVKANDVTIKTKDLLPAFTSTITGFINGDEQTITSGPNYLIDPAYVAGTAGQYSIIPYGLTLPNQDYYNIQYLPGVLTVVPTCCDNGGGGGKPGKGNNKNSRTLGGAGSQKTNINGSLISGIPGSQNEISAEIVDAVAYPNPTIGIVTIQVKNFVLSDKNIVVTDLLGRIINTSGLVRSTGNTIQVDMRSFERGAYFIKLKVNDDFKTFKILKQ